MVCSSGKLRSLGCSSEAAILNFFRVSFFSPFPKLTSGLWLFFFFFCLDQITDLSYDIQKNRSSNITLHLFSHLWYDNDKRKALACFSVQSVPDFYQNKCSAGILNENCCKNTNNWIQWPRYMVPCISWDVYSVSQCPIAKSIAPDTHRQETALKRRYQLLKYIAAPNNFKIFPY